LTVLINYSISGILPAVSYDAVFFTTAALWAILQFVWVAPGHDDHTIARLAHLVPELGFNHGAD
jgi:hypothetical protein